MSADKELSDRLRNWAKELRQDAEKPPPFTLSTSFARRIKMAHLARAADLSRAANLIDELRKVRDSGHTT